MSIDVKNKMKIYVDGALPLISAGIASDFETIDAVEKIGQLAVLTKIVSEFATLMEEADYSSDATKIMQKITAADNKLKNSVEWRAYLKSNNIDVPETTPISTPTVTPKATPNNSEDEVIYFKCVNIENAIRNVIGKAKGNTIRRDVNNITELSLSWCYLENKDILELANLPNLIV